MIFYLLFFPPGGKKVDTYFRENESSEASGINTYDMACGNKHSNLEFIYSGLNPKQQGAKEQITSSTLNDGFRDGRRARNFFLSDADGRRGSEGQITCHILIFVNVTCDLSHPMSTHPGRVS